LPSGTAEQGDMVDRISPKQTESERPRSAVDVVEAGSRSDPGALLDADVSAEAILAVNPDAVLGVDSGGTISIANRAAAEQFGYTLDQLVGGSIDRLLPASVRHRHRPLMQGFFTEPASRPMGSGLPLSALRRNR
jgi:PAS domain-containing protein